MSGPAFYGEHSCDQCSRFVHEHPTRCFLEEPWGGEHGHFPALCCPECPCGSFAEAHPDVCLKHPDGEQTVVCGELFCGACYGEALLAEALPKARPLATLDLSKGWSGQMEVSHFRGYGDDAKHQPET